MRPCLMRRYVWPRSLRGVLLLAASLVASPASAAMVFVGPASDPDCDYATVQAAVDAWAASPDEEFWAIFIANTQSWTAQAITIPTPAASSGIGLRGEYPGCRLGGVQGRATLSGSGGVAAPVIDIVGSTAGEAARFEVVILEVDVTGGDHAGGNGGGVRVRGNVVLTIGQARIHGNTAANGGGVALEATPAGAPHLILAGNSLPATIEDNVATQDGGGFYCANATIYCDRHCRIAGNDAGDDGGGIAQTECGTSLYFPRSSAPPNPEAGMQGNTAVDDGGAAWVSGGYFSTGGFGATSPSPIADNVAGGDGGGVYYTAMSTSGSSSQHVGIQFDRNSAGGAGGAIFMDSGFMHVYSPPGGASCADGIESCSRFEGNVAADGGAIALRGTSNLLLSEQLFADNEALRGSVLDLAGANHGATLTNVHVSGSRGASEVIRSSGGYVDLRYVTIGENNGDDTALIRFDVAGALTASNSILHDLDGVDSGVAVAAVAGTTFAINCMLVHDDSGLDGAPGVSNLISADPQWDTSGEFPAGLYGPGPSSPAVDACGFGTGAIPDLLGTARPADTPAPNGAGAFDMGAIERPVIIEIFADGFESP
jgi:predicted outer membrane repeat protein